MGVNNIFNNSGVYNQLNKSVKPVGGKQNSKLKSLDDLSGWIDSMKNTRDMNKVETNQGTGVSKANESALSEKAQDYLSSLREKYGDYDFFVGNEGDDLTAIAGAGTREFSIVFSSEELEKMAADEEYAAQKLQAMENAVAMSSGLLEEAEEGEKIELGDGVSINRVTIAFKEDGSMQIFAEAEKSSERQRERIEKQREEKADEAGKSPEPQVQPGTRPNPYETEPQVKKVIVEASNIDELLTKIKDINWDEVQEENLAPGGRFSFSV